MRLSFDTYGRMKHPAYLSPRDMQTKTQSTVFHETREYIQQCQADRNRKRGRRIVPCQNL